MPLATDYASLSQKIADYAHRTDLFSPSAGTSLTDYFLQDAQAKINKDIFDQNLGNGISLMEAPYGPQVITNGVTPIPSGYLAPKFFTVTDNGGNLFTLILKDPEWLYSNYPLRQAQGLPAYIARDATGFVFGPYPDSAYSIGGTFYQAAPLLNQSQTTNWMVTSAPDTLFAAAMIQAMLFMRDSEGVSLWQGVYQDALQKLIDQDKAERWGSATMVVDTA